MISKNNIESLFSAIAKHHIDQSRIIDCVFAMCRTLVDLMHVDLQLWFDEL